MNGPHFVYLYSKHITNLPAKYDASPRTFPLCKFACRINDLHLLNVKMPWSGVESIEILTLAFFFFSYLIIWNVCVCWCLTWCYAVPCKDSLSRFRNSNEIASCTCLFYLFVICRNVEHLNFICLSSRSFFLVCFFHVFQFVALCVYLWCKHR